MFYISIDKCNYNGYGNQKNVGETLTNMLLKQCLLIVIIVC